MADYVDGEAQDILREKTLDNAQLRAEIAKVEKMTKNAIDNGIVPGTDVTDKYLVNADFETTSGNTGWISNHASGGNVDYGGNSKNHCFQAWNNPGFDVYQEVSNAPVGVYTISVQGFFRYGRYDNAWKLYSDGTAEKYKNAVQIYVNDNTANFMSVFDEHVKYLGNHEGELYTWDADVNAGGNCQVNIPDSTYWYPNGMSNSAVAFQNGLYKTTSYGVVAKKGDKLRVGVRGVSNQLGDSWAIWDNFKMVFEGTKAEAVKPLLEAKSQEVSDTLANSQRVFGKTEVETAEADIEKGRQATEEGNGKAMFDALCSLIADQGEMEKSAVTFDTLRTEAETLAKTIEKFAANADAAVLSEAQALLDEVTAHLQAKDLEKAQAHEYSEKLREAAAKVRVPKGYANATPDQPVDFTSVIVNPGYEDNGANSFEGWTETAGNHNFGNDDTQRAALLVEYYHQKFNVFQTLSCLPDGKYCVEVKGFYRFGSPAEDYAVYSADPSTEGKAFLYCTTGDDSGKSVALSLLASGAHKDTGIDGVSKVDNGNLVVPNNMVSANSWFKDGYYVNALEVNVKGGTLTIGVIKDEDVDQDWVIFDDWKLFYLGSDATPIHGVIDGVALEPVVTEIYNVSGERQNALRQGINIVKFKDAKGKTSVRKVVVR